MVGGRANGSTAERKKEGPASRQSASEVSQPRPRGLCSSRPPSSPLSLFLAAQSPNFLFATLTLSLSSASLSSLFIMLKKPDWIQ